MKRRIVSLFFAAFLLLAPAFAARPVLAAAMTETLDLLSVRQNQRGEGYEWANRSDTLTLRGLSIETSERYGLRIKDGATVVLEGDNYIRASYAALDIEGSATFKGTGTLTLVADAPDGIGFLNPANAKNHRVNLTGGTYRITAARGIVSERAEWSLTGGSVTIAATDTAIEGRVVKILGGSLTANAPLRASNELKISYAAVELSASSAVLLSDKTLSLSGLVTREGKAVGSEDYAGESVFSVLPAKKGRTTSLLFGRETPIFVDYLIIAAAALILAAVILIPRQKKKKSLAAARARFAAEQAAKNAKKEKTDDR